MNNRHFKHVFVGSCPTHSYFSVDYNFLWQHLGFNLRIKNTMIFLFFSHDESRIEASGTYFLFTINHKIFFSSCLFNFLISFNQKNINAIILFLFQLDFSFLDFIFIRLYPIILLTVSSFLYLYLVIFFLLLPFRFRL